MEIPIFFPNMKPNMKHHVGMVLQLNPSESSYDLGPSTTFFPPSDQDTQRSCGPGWCERWLINRLTSKSGNWLTWRDTRPDQNRWSTRNTDTFFARKMVFFFPVGKYDGSGGKGSLTDYSARSRRWKSWQRCVNVSSWDDDEMRVIDGW